MFNDFDGEHEEDASRGRKAASLGVSLLIYGGLAAFALTAVTAARAVVREEVIVEFMAPPPMPVIEEPPAPEPEPEIAPRPRRRRNDRRPRVTRSPVDAPTEIPEGDLAESDGELAEAGEVGPVDGVYGGEGEGEPAEEPLIVVDAPPPPRERGQVRETVRRPRYLSGCRAPVPPDAIRTQAATIRVLVRMIISPEGEPTHVSVVEGHPLIPEQLITDCASEQRFAAATLPDGTEVPYPYMRRFVFRPSNL